MNLINSGIKDITWTGGEALLLDGLDQLLKIASDNKVKNKLITNGKLLTNKRIDDIYKYLDSITLSLDSICAETNLSLGRGRQHFIEIKRILDYLNKYDVKININTVVSKENLNDIRDIIIFLNNYKIYNWRLFKFMPLREKAVINQKKFDITLYEYEMIMKEVVLNSKCKNIYSRMKDDMIHKYILILANGDIVVSQEDLDIKIGNALNYNDLLNLEQNIEKIF